MAVVSIGVISRLMAGKTFPRINTILLLQNYLRSELLASPVVYTSKRWASYATRRRESKFPKEDGITRREELLKKLNPVDKRFVDKEVPADCGVKIDSTGQIFNYYVPQEKKSPGQLWAATKANLKSTYAIAMIKRKGNKPFKAVEFAQIAQKKFIDLNNDLQLKYTKDVELRLKENATLLVVDALKAQFQNPAKKIYWRYIKELRRPRVVNAQIVHVGDKENLYAQVTVQMFTEQILAIRDRYDRLLVGSLKNSKNVTDNVVFEIHIADPYGNWRICGKING